MAIKNSSSVQAKVAIPGQTNYCESCSLTQKALSQTLANTRKQNLFWLQLYQRLSQLAPTHLQIESRTSKMLPALSNDCLSATGLAEEGCRCVVEGLQPSFPGTRLELVHKPHLVQAMLMKICCKATLEIELITSSVCSSPHQLSKWFVFSIFQSNRMHLL